MNFFEKKARQIVQQRLMGGRIHDAKKLLEIVKNDLYDVDSKSDKISYLTIILEANDSAYTEHLKVCVNGPSCSHNQDFEMVNYFLQQELRRIGVEINEDVFTREEKSTISQYFDQFAKDLKDLKDGQQVIYDDLLAEIEELKKWFIIGKKNWRQMAVGKIGEMVAGGVISEATAKPLVETIKSSVQHLLA